MDKSDFVHRPIFVQIRCRPHTKSLTGLYRMQVLVLIRFFALIHRNRVLLTTTIKHVYLLVLVNKEQRLRAGRPSRRCCVHRRFDGRQHRSDRPACQHELCWFADASNPGTRHAGGTRTASPAQWVAPQPCLVTTSNIKSKSPSTRFAGARARSRIRPVDKSMHIHRCHLWITACLSTAPILSRFDAAPIQSR